MFDNAELRQEITMTGWAPKAFEAGDGERVKCAKSARLLMPPPYEQMISPGVRLAEATMDQITVTELMSDEGRANRNSN